VNNIGYLTCPASRWPAARYRKRRRINGGSNNIVGRVKTDSHDRSKRKPSTATTHTGLC
jgi:hypothetical protein